MHVHVFQTFTRSPAQFERLHLTMESDLYLDPDLNFQEYADSVPLDPQVQAADLSKNLRK